MRRCRRGSEVALWFSISSTQTVIYMWVLRPGLRVCLHRLTSKRPGAAMLYKVLPGISVLFSAVSILQVALAALPSGTVTCGSNQYSVSAIEAAINAGVEDMQEGNYPDDYPHQYYDEPSEHIELYCNGDGPWYEFPIMSDGSIYTSTPSDYRSPGPDRVVFTEDGTYCAVVTHTGASSSNGFVACDND